MVQNKLHTPPTRLLPLGSVAKGFPARADTTTHGPELGRSIIKGEKAFLKRTTLKSPTASSSVM